MAVFYDFGQVQALNCPLSPAFYLEPVNAGGLHGNYRSHSIKYKYADSVVRRIGTLNLSFTLSCRKSHLS